MCFWGSSSSSHSTFLGEGSLWRLLLRQPPLLWTIRRHLHTPPATTLLNVQKQQARATSWISTLCLAPQAPQLKSNSQQLLHMVLLNLTLVMDQAVPDGFLQDFLSSAEVWLHASRPRQQQSVRKTLRLKIQPRRFRSKWHKRVYDGPSPEHQVAQERAAHDEVRSRA